MLSTAFAKTRSARNPLPSKVFRIPLQLSHRSMMTTPVYRSAPIHARTTGYPYRISEGRVPPPPAAFHRGSVSLTSARQNLTRQASLFFRTSVTPVGSLVETTITIVAVWLTGIWFAPYMFGWPPELKDDLCAGTWAIVLGQWQKVIHHLGRAWIQIQSLTPEALNCDPNFKILKVAYLLSVGLIHDGQALAAYHVLADALALRTKRLEEQFKTTSPAPGQKSIVSVSSDERALVIFMCIDLYHLARQLGPAFAADEDYWLRQAYEESMKLNRAKDADTGKELYETAPDTVLLTGIESTSESFVSSPDGGETDERCHRSPMQDFLFFNPGWMGKRSGLDLISEATELMGDSALKQKDYILSVNSFWISLLNVLHVAKVPEEDNALVKNIVQRVMRIQNKFVKAILELYDAFPEERSTSCLLDLVTSDLLGEEDFDRIAQRRGKEVIDAYQYSRFSFLRGQIYFRKGQMERAAEKFKQAMEIARNAGRAEEERNAARELEAVKQHLITRKEPRPVTSETDRKTMPV